MNDFWLAFVLLLIMFSPASCVRDKGDKSIAMAIVDYLERQK